MIERLKLFMDSYNLSAADLADEIDVQRSGISHLLSGRNNPSLSFITKLLEHYSELSPDWLLFDKGSMIRGDLKEKKQENNPPGDLFQEIERKSEKETHPKMEQILENEDNNKEMKEKQVEIRPLDEIQKEISGNIEKIVVFYQDRTFIEYKSR